MINNIVLEIIVLEHTHYKLEKLKLYWNSQIDHKFNYSEIINYIINKEYWELMQLEEFRKVNEGEENEK